MIKGNVKLDPNVLGTLQKLDDLQHGINASGIFALLVINMNQHNVSRVSMSKLISSSVRKSQLVGIRLNVNESVQAMVNKTLRILEDHHLIKAQHLPLSEGEVCFQVNPDVAQL